MSYRMPLAEMLASIDVQSTADVEITGLELDSRQIQQGDLFVACPGIRTDGRDYIAAAAAAGAAAVLFERADFVPNAELKIPAIAVTNLAGKLGHLADCFYRQPSAELQVFGVTGTNGKTTSCYLLVQALSALGVQAAMIGTIGVGPLDDLVAGKHTTPDAIATHRLLAGLRDRGFTQVCMEVSSHALDQGRVVGVRFFCTLFTNLSHDHLDYHGDMRAYATAKRRLFTDFHSELVITNFDDELGAGLIDVADAEFIASYSQRGSDADVTLEEAEMSADGMRLSVQGNGLPLELTTALVGSVNIPNILLVVTTLLALSTDAEQVVEIVASLRPAPGRMELHTSKGKPRVVIDYAHTPDALEKALTSLRSHCAGDLWCVFGCGGDRDIEKRPLMGAAAARLADHLIVTNDNPRSELPQQIADHVCAGIDRDVQVVLDRAAAIKTAIDSGTLQDWVLIAGKGHETTQTIGDASLPFSDREHVLRNLGVAA